MGSPLGFGTLIFDLMRNLYIYNAYIYIHSITNASELFKFICYADDTALSSTIQYLNANVNGINNTFETIINYELSKISEWLNIYKLSLNTEKIKFHKPQKRK